MFLHVGTVVGPKIASSLGVSPSGSDAKDHHEHSVQYSLAQAMERLCEYLVLSDSENLIPSTSCKSLK